MLSALHVLLASWGGTPTELYRVRLAHFKDKNLEDQGVHMSAQDDAADSGSRMRTHAFSPDSKQGSFVFTDYTG